MKICLSEYTEVMEAGRYWLGELIGVAMNMQQSLDAFKSANLNPAMVEEIGKRQAMVNAIQKSADVFGVLLMDHRIILNKLETNCKDAKDI